MNLLPSRVAGSVAGASIALAAVALTHPQTAHAVPGPESVVVLANATVPESVDLAHRYAAARAIPDRQVCLVSTLATDIITLANYQTQVLAPFERCLADAGVTDRIEAVVLIRGLPLAVTIPLAPGTVVLPVSLAAAIGLGHSTTTRDGAPLLGQPSGYLQSNGYYHAIYSNPFRNGTFHAGWTATSAGVNWHPLMVTALDARSYTDAARLIQSAADAETTGGARGEFLLMHGNGVTRSLLDTEFPAVTTALNARGFTAVSTVPFNSDLTGHRLAAFFVGTSTLGTTIEGNTYLPGALVDNLTSSGAAPGNFHATGQSQVAITRWVAAGVAGVHGTVAEPLADAFPSRQLLVDYVDGCTLAESYFRRLPFIYWRNLVLGDPMTAPYASRPAVTLVGATDGTTLTGAVRVTAHATDAMSRPIAWTALFVDGVVVARQAGATASACVAPLPGAARQVLAVAQVADDGSRGGVFQPKGWRSIHVTGLAGTGTCVPDVDAGSPDAAVDAAADDVLIASDVPETDIGQIDVASADSTAPLDDDAGDPLDGAITTNDAAPLRDSVAAESDGSDARGSDVADADGGGSNSTARGCGCATQGRSNNASRPVALLALAATLLTSRGRGGRRRVHPKKRAKGSDPHE